MYDVIRRAKKFHSSIAGLLPLFLLICFSARGAGAGEIPFTPAIFVGPYGAAIKLADLDGDGDQDFASFSNQIIYKSSFNYRQMAQFAWFERNDSEPTSFTQHEISLAQPQLDNTILSLDAGDLNGDKRVDLIISRGDGNMTWYENNGAQPPDFTPHVLGQGENPSFTDLDQDGDMDIVFIRHATRTGNTIDHTIYWLENNGAQPPVFNEHTIFTFGTTIPYDTIPPSYISISTVADLDCDGFPDLILCTRDGWSWLHNRGTSPMAFDSPRPISGVYFDQPVIHDIDGDGWPDVLIGSTWHHNDQATSFTTVQTSMGYPGYASAIFLGAADLNQDGWLDLLDSEAERNGIYPLYYTYKSYWSKNGGGVGSFYLGHLLLDFCDSDGLSPYGHRPIPWITLTGLEPNRNGQPELLAGSYQNLYLLRNQGPRRSVSLITPNGGQVYHAGQTIEIAWRSDVPTAGSAVGLELWEGMERKVALLKNAWQKDGHGRDVITLPPVPPRHNYRLRAVSLWDNQYYDFNDETMTILEPKASVNERWSCYE